MFQRLKECKTFKEIFTLVGTKPFEKAAFIIVLLWCLLPIYWMGERVYWTIFAENDYAHTYAIMAGHMYAMRVLGSFSLYVAIFFLISRISVYGKDVWKKIKAEPWHFFLLAVLLWGCISTTMAKDVKLAFEGDTYLGEGLRAYFFYAGAYVCAFMITNKKSKWVLLNVFNVVANIVSLIIIVVDRTDIPFLEECFPGKLSAVFFHFNHAGYYINMGIVCAMGLYLYEKSRKIRLWYAFSIAFQIYGILVNSTLGSFIATCGAMVMILIFFRRKTSKFAWRMLTPIVLVIVLVAASYFGFVPTSSGEDMKVNFGQLFDDGKAVVTNSEDADMIGHGRMTLWKQSLKMIPESPLFGYGPEHLDEAYSLAMWVNRPDNEFIQHAVFMGVPALLYYLIALIGLFIHQWKHMKQLDKGILVAAGCMIAYIISAMFGVSAFYTTPYLYMFWGMAAGRPQTEPAEVTVAGVEMKDEEKKIEDTQSE